MSFNIVSVNNKKSAPDDCSEFEFTDNIAKIGIKQPIIILFVLETSNRYTYQDNSKQLQ